MATSSINGVTYKWTDPATGADTPVGVGSPTPVTGVPVQAASTGGGGSWGPTTPPTIATTSPVGIPTTPTAFPKETMAQANDPNNPRWANYVPYKAPTMPPLALPPTPAVNTTSTNTTTSTATKTLTAEQKAQLDFAAQRNNTTDQANIAYAVKNYGYKVPTASPTIPSVPTSLPKAVVTAPDITAASTPTPNTTSSFMSGVKSWQEELKSLLAPDQSNIDALTGERKSLRDRLGSAMDDLAGKASRTDELRTQAGIPALQKQLGDLNVQIATLTAQFDKGLSAITDINATGLSTTIAGKAGELQRQKAVAIGGLVAVQQALSGNLALAQQTITDTVNLEFEDKQAIIDNLATQLDFNAEDLTAAEAKKAEHQQLIITARQDALDELKTDRANILNLALEAAKNGADNQTITKITQAKTLEDAFAAAGQSLNQRAPATRETSLAEADGRRVLIDTQSGEVIADLGDINSPLDYAKYAMELAKLEGGSEDFTMIDGRPYRTIDGQLVPVPMQEILNPGAIQEQQLKINQIDEVLNNKALFTFVGPNGLTRGALSAYFLNDLEAIYRRNSGEGQQFLGGMEQIVADETMKKLLALKAAGGTLGALSDGEREMLAKGATKFPSWAIRDKEGKLLGFDIDEASFKKELTTLQSLAQKIVAASGQAYESGYNSSSGSVTDDWSDL